MSATVTSGFALADPALAFSGTIAPTRLSPTYRNTDAAIVRSRQREENAEAIRQFFGKAFTPYRPVRLTLGELASQDTRSLTALMAAARRAMNAAEPTRSAPARNSTLSRRGAARRSWPQSCTPQR